MTGLIDTNILLDIFLRREQFYEESFYVVKIFKERDNLAYLAFHSLSNLSYILTSELSSDEAVKHIRMLMEWAKIPDTSTETAKRALSLELKDFEDALQLASAEACNAHCLVTRNRKDFLGTDSEVEILTPGEFVEGYS